MKVFSRLKIIAAKPRRAWSGKLEKIDQLLAWMYDKDILTKTDKARKDSLFRQYYRYYNDGDFPRGLSSKGLSKWSPENKIEEALEEILEKFIKEILSKYAGKYSRTDFHFDQLNDAIDDTLRELDLSRGYFNPNDVKYWYDKIPSGNKDEELSSIINSITELDKKCDEEIEEILKKNKDAMLESGIKSYDLPGKNRTLSFNKRALEQCNLWNSKLQNYWKQIEDLTKKASDKLKLVKESINKLRNLM